jgi:hypothetical protein
MSKKYNFLLLLLPLAGAVAGPLAYFKFFDHGTPGAAATVDGVPAANLLVAATGANGAGPRAGLAIAATSAAKPSAVRVYDPGSIFNFQITPEWILAHWPSVSTGLAQLQLEGYRVPLVTGIGQQDLAGALTYYFNAKQKLQRITFVGVTGDPRSLIGLLVERFAMTRRLTNDPGLVVYEAAHDGDRPLSGLQIRLAPLEPGETFRRYNIELVLERSEE